MSTFKKLLALTLALAMVLSVSAFAGYKADTYKDAASIDEDCESSIELMYALEIMKGDANGNFNPKATITRAEVAKMIYVILNYGKDDLAVNYKGANVFSDVAVGSWYEGYVTYAYMHKLVNGRGNGTFGPNDPVTTAEAAKMLLTAIGYSAEARGYTGGNWAFNVLNDARILGLLDGYNYSTTGYAPRQWVAVMFDNALSCYTFDTMRPTFSGLLISGEAETAHKTMGSKYYGLTEFNGYLYATPNAWIDVQVAETDADDEPTKWYIPSTGEITGDITKDFSAAADEVMFSNGKDALVTSSGAKNYLVIETDEVGVQDLGQYFRVIYNANNDKIYSIKATGKSDAYEAMVKDIEGEIKHKNYNNDENNRYEFTIGEFEGKFNDTLKVAELWNNGEFNWSDDTYTAEFVYNNLGKIVKTDMVKVIDRDGDGDIEYAIYTAYDYGKVTAAKEQKYHGEYITVQKLTKEENLKWNGKSYLYLDEVITTEDEFAKNDYVKYSWNYDEMCYELEKMEAFAATYEAKSRYGVYTFDGEDYLVADNGTAADDLAEKRKDTEYNVLADDNLLVKVWADKDYMTLEELNGSLALVTGLTTTFDTGFYSDTNAIRFITLAGGEPVDAPYYMGEDLEEDEGAAAMTWAELKAEFGFEKEADLTNYANIAEDEVQLYILHTLKSGKVWLEKMEDGKVIADTEDDLVYDLNATNDVKLDITEATIGAKDVAVENTYFVGIEDDGDVEYKVMTLEELGEVTANVLHSEFILDDGVVDNVLGGYVLINGTNLNGDAADGYVWLTSDVTVKGYYNNKYYADLLFIAEEIEDARIAVDGETVKSIDDLVVGELYAYEWNLDKEYYVLSAVDFKAENDYDDNFDELNWSEIAKITSNNIIYKKYTAAADSSNDEDFFTRKVKDYPVALYVELHEMNVADQPYEVETFVMWTTLADLLDGTVTIETREIGEVAVKVINGSKIEDTFTVLSDSKIVDVDEEEVVLIELKVEEISKQID